MNFSICCKPESIKTAVNSIVSFAKEKGFNDQVILDNIKLASHEALVNAMMHGNKCKEDAKINVELNFINGKLSISVTDQGVGFDYNGIVKCDIKKFSDCGRGIFLIKNITDGMEFTNGGKTIVMLFNALQ